MADQRFFRRAGPFRLGELAERIGAQLEDPAANDCRIEDLANLTDARPGELSLLTERRHMQAFTATRASAVVTSNDFTGAASAGRTHLVVVPEPRLAYARLGKLFYPSPRMESGTDPRAVVAADARIGEACRIEAGAMIGAGAMVGDRCHIGANAVIGPGVVLGNDCMVGPNASLGHALIGDRVQIYAGVTIGTPGFGFVAGPTGPIRVPQLGRVIVEDDVEIGANSTVDRGALGDTVIGRGTVIDNLVQIAHNVRIGQFCVLAAQSGVAGSTVLGDGVMVGGQVAIKDHLVVGDGAQIAGKSGVMRDVEPGGRVGGYPALPIREWHRLNAGLLRLFGRRPG